jgi:hypothetical protein
MTAQTNTKNVTQYSATVTFQVFGLFHHSADASCFKFQPHI